MKTVLLFSFDYGAGYVWHVAFCLSNDFPVQLGDHFADLHPFCGWGSSKAKKWTLESGMDYLHEVFPGDSDEPYFVDVDKVSVFYNFGEQVRVVQGGVLLHERHSTVCGDDPQYIDVIFFLIEHLAEQFDTHAYVKYSENDVTVPEAFAPVKGWTHCVNPAFAAALMH